jgi:hypothetical protein
MINSGRPSFEQVLRFTLCFAADLLQLMYREGLDFREECWWVSLCQDRSLPDKEKADAATSPLVWAVVYKCVPAVSALLSVSHSLGDTEFVNRPGPDGRLPLVVAVKDRNHELCKMLVEAGADVLLAQKDNVCPLWACATARASNVSTKVTELLMEAVKMRLKHDRGPVLEVLQQRRLHDMTLAQYAMLVHDDRLILLLATTGAQVNLVYTGDTPLRSACLVRQ